MRERERNAVGWTPVGSNGPENPRAIAACHAGARLRLTPRVGAPRIIHEPEPRIAAMSDTARHPEHQPAVEDLSGSQEQIRDVADAEAEQTRGGLGFPDYAKTPSPAGPIPIPYPNFPK
ncbi:MAG TPA: hypothetical protein VKA84_22475 [Gemmatimonadaceae bacterium]|nr:hypothetical protein [Gemmatimonadaceae bacterium]